MKEIDVHVSTELQFAHIMIKALARAKFEAFRTMSVVALQDVAEPTEKHCRQGAGFVRCLQQHTQANITTMCTPAGYLSNCKSRKKYGQKQVEFAQKKEFRRVRMRQAQIKDKKLEEKCVTET